MISAIIFDLYGTLIEMPTDSLPFHKLARRLPAGQRKQALEICLTTDCPTLSEFCKRVGLAPQDDLATLESGLFDDIDAIRLFPDVIPVLESLKEHGIATALISNLATPYKRPIVDHSLDSLFDVEVLSCDVGLIKPEEEIYLTALKRLGVTPGASLMVGDSYSCDVEGPQRVGIEGLHLIRSAEHSTTTSSISSLDAVLAKTT